MGLCDTLFEFQKKYFRGLIRSANGRSNTNEDNAPPQLINSQYCSIGMKTGGYILRCDLQGFDTCVLGL